jgi:hypothetical protein
VGDHTHEFAIDPGAVRRGVSLWLDPVIHRLDEINNSFTAAKEKVDQGQSGASGWVGGEGHGVVRDATVSFFSQVSASLQFLRIDQGQTINSLNTYRDMLLKHAAWAERTDAQQAQRFNSIADRLPEVR